MTLGWDPVASTAMLFNLLSRKYLCWGVSQGYMFDWQVTIKKEKMLDCHELLQSSPALQLFLENGITVADYTFFLPPKCKQSTFWCGNLSYKRFQICPCLVCQLGQTGASGHGSPAYKQVLGASGSKEVLGWHSLH